MWVQGAAARQKTGPQPWLSNVLKEDRRERD
jgi:hypothetical protein